MRIDPNELQIIRPNQLVNNTIGDMKPWANDFSCCGILKFVNSSYLYPITCTLLHILSVKYNMAVGTNKITVYPHCAGLSFMK